MGLIPIMSIQLLPRKELAMSLIKSCLEIVYEMCMSLLRALHLLILFIPIGSMYGIFA